jgi:chemosensory pili system protein ChpA (sensor histidine kinase/response regulator)
MPRILVVDDNPAVREVVRTVLVRHGHEAVTAGDGTAALAVLAKQPFDLALLDIEMPEMTGYDLCTYIKTHREWRRMPVILMTGRTILGVPEKVRAVGAATLIAKPFQQESLVSCINAVIKNAATDAEPGK